MTTAQLRQRLDDCDARIARLHRELERATAAREAVAQLVHEAQHQEALA